jgi:hypothetical protein
MHIERDNLPKDLTAQRSLAYEQAFAAVDAMCLKPFTGKITFSVVAGHAEAFTTVKETEYAR